MMNRCKLIIQKILKKPHKKLPQSTISFPYTQFSSPNCWPKKTAPPNSCYKAFKYQTLVYRSKTLQIINKITKVLWIPSIIPLSPNKASCCLHEKLVFHSKTLQIPNLTLRIPRKMPLFPKNMLQTPSKAPGIIHLYSSGFPAFPSTTPSPSKTLTSANVQPRKGTPQNPPMKEAGLSGKP